jgi:uncharacterized membrane protein
MNTRIRNGSPDVVPYIVYVALFGAVAAAGYFILVNAAPFLNYAADSYGPYWAVSAWMLLHVCGGIAAVLVGALQLTLGFLARTSRLHRWCGRIYVAIVLISCSAALVVLAHGSAIGPGFAVLVATLAIYTSAFTCLGVIAILRGERLAHRAWMIRSYMGVMVFGLFRGALETSLLSELPLAERFTALMGLTMSVTLVATEMLIQLGLPPSSLQQKEKAPSPLPALARRGSS